MIAKTYTPLIELPTVLITSCTQVLPNKLQCWKAGDYLVEETLPGDPTADPPVPDSTRSYQLCAMHTTIQQRADALTLQEESSGRAQPPAGDPKSIHSKMLQVEQRTRTTTLPSGEKSAQR